MSRSLLRHQHLDPHRKYLLRSKLLRWAVDGSVYCPFIGDGDIAAGGSKPGALKHEVYGKPGLYLGRELYGADSSRSRVKVARSRLPGADIRVADCDEWPFSDVEATMAPVAIADVDSYSQPWDCFRAWWSSGAPKADRVCIAVTSGQKLGTMVEGLFVDCDGERHRVRDLRERRELFNFMWSKHILPWWTAYVGRDGFRVVDRLVYARGMLLYAGIVVERVGIARPGMIG